MSGGCRFCDGTVFENVGLCSDCVSLLEEQNSNSLQHTQAKIPTLEECQKEVQSRIWAGGFVGTSTNITETVYNFMCRHIGCA